jgi:hypothetical protein
VHVDPHFEHDGAPTRKPGIGMVLDYLKSGELDLRDSWVIGDRETDLQLAANMGIGGLRLGGEFADWAAIAHHLADRPRQATVTRKTRETDIRVFVDLDAGRNPGRGPAAAACPPVSASSTTCWTNWPATAASASSSAAAATWRSTSTTPWRIARWPWARP